MIPLNVHDRQRRKEAYASGNPALLKQIILPFLIACILQTFCNEGKAVSSYRCLSQNFTGDVGSLSTTSAQFISSTGGCAWFESEIQRKRDIFFDSNFENIKADASRGDGEFMNTFLSLYFCSLEDARIVKIKIKDSYSTLFEDEPANSIKFPKKADRFMIQAEFGIYKIITKEMVGTSCHK